MLLSAGLCGARSPRGRCPEAASGRSQRAGAGEDLGAAADDARPDQQLGGWIEDYNTRAPHSALGTWSPAEYRAILTLSSPSVR